MLQGKVDQITTLFNLALDRTTRRAENERKRKTDKETSDAARLRSQDSVSRNAGRAGVDLRGPTHTATSTVGADPPPATDFNLTMDAWGHLSAARSDGSAELLGPLADFFSRLGALKPEQQARLMRLLYSAMQGEHRTGAAGAKPGTSFMGGDGADGPQTAVGRQLDAVMRAAMSENDLDVTLLLRVARGFLHGGPLRTLASRFQQMPPSAQRAILSADADTLRGALELLVGRAQIKGLGAEALAMFRSQLTRADAGRWEASTSPRAALYALLAELAAFNLQQSPRIALDAMVAPLYGFQPLPLLQKLLAKMSEKERRDFWRRVGGTLCNRVGAGRAGPMLEAAKKDGEFLALLAGSEVFGQDTLDNLYVVGHLLGQGDPLVVSGDPDNPYPSTAYVHENEAGAFEKLALHIRDDLDPSDRDYVIYKIERTPAMSDLGRALAIAVYSPASPANALGGTHEMAQLNALAHQVLDAAPSLRHYL